MMHHLVAALVLLLMASCAPPETSLQGFQRWLAAGDGRAETFARFEATLREAGVAVVVPTYQLWRADQINPECIAAPYAIPPEADWPNIVPTLRFLRDHVKPAIGALEVRSAYREPAFNACVRGAPQSAHKLFFALDLEPAESGVTRAALIATLCPLHARLGPGADIGLGIYGGRRFHVDARRFRGWGADYHAATFPCRAL